MAFKVNSPQKKEKVRKVLREDSFIMDDDGEQANAYGGRLFNQGFKNLYYTAPYHWALINFEKKQIVTYTEGDVSKYTFSNDKEMKKYIDNLKSYYKKDDKRVYGQIVRNVKTPNTDFIV